MEDKQTEHSGPTGITITDPDVSVSLEPDGTDHVKLTVKWQGTSLQERTNQMTLALETSQLQAFVQDIIDIANHKTDDVAKATIGPDKLTISPGVAKRPDGATVELQHTDQGKHALKVQFYERNLHDRMNEIRHRLESNIQAIEFSKANYVNSLEYTEDWRTAWQRAIALAWSDPGLKHKLVHDPFLFLKEHCNYALPPTVELLVVPCETLKPRLPSEHDTLGFHAEQGHDNGPNWKWVLPRTVVIMSLPPPPGGWDHPDQNSYAVALNAYDAVGKSYPFTVSC